MPQKLKKNFKKNILSFLASKQNLVILVIGLAAMWIRSYNVDKILGFYFDEGRDALVIWRLTHEGKLFLIGPTTGIAGIFRGPFYYYLITPLYFLGNGNPVWPANFLSFTTVIATLLMGYLAYKFTNNKLTGFVAIVIGSFSYYLIVAARWLSNPTPMFLLSQLLIFFLYLVTKGKRWAWMPIAFILGSSLFHFGSSGELFYFPVVLAIFLWQKKNWPDKKIFAFSVLLFIITALPQIVFDIRHDGILRNNILKFFVADKSFKFSFWEILALRLEFYKDVIFSKIWPGNYHILQWFFVISGLSLIINFSKFWKNDGFKIVLLLCFSPLLGLLFFQGNHGNVYDYYFTGYYLVFVLLFSMLLSNVFKTRLINLVILIPFGFYFFNFNLPVVKNYLDTGRSKILFGYQKQAIDWIYEDAGGKEFNVDVYVPPVIPYAYEYLFMWYGQGKYGYPPAISQEGLYYSLWEEDNDHPQFLNPWLDKQNSIGKLESVAKFGGITVEKRYVK